MKYYSELLKRPFTTVEELEKAEQEKQAQIDALKVKTRERTTRAKEVENAYKNWVELKNKYFEEIDKAYEKYQELLNQFVKDYGSFHMTYTNENGVETYNLKEIADNTLNSFLALMNLYR